MARPLEPPSVKVAMVGLTGICTVAVMGETVRSMSGCRLADAVLTVDDWRLK